MHVSDMWLTWRACARAQVNAQVCCVAYDTGETEELPVDDVIRDGIMSLGWQRACPASGASSARCFSATGVFCKGLGRVAQTYKNFIHGHSAQQGAACWVAGLLAR